MSNVTLLHVLLVIEIIAIIISIAILIKVRESELNQEKLKEENISKIYFRGKKQNNINNDSQTEFNSSNEKNNEIIPEEGLKIRKEEYLIKKEDYNEINEEENSIVSVKINENKESEKDKLNTFNNVNNKNKIEKPKDKIVIDVKKNKNKDNESSENDFSFVSKSWEEPRTEPKTKESEIYTKFQEPMKSNQQNIIKRDYDKEDIEVKKYESKYGEISNKEGDNQNNKETSSQENNLKEENSSEEKYPRKNSKYGDYYSTHKINEKQEDNKNTNRNRDQSNLKRIGDNKKVQIGNSVIFYYKGESYLSKVLEISNDTIKIRYKGQNQWIDQKDIKKIL